jgi:lipopolysaccharide assembly outer membrane protein LptD (OstA)
MRKALFALAAVGLLGLVIFYFLQDGDYKPQFRLSENSYMENVKIIQKKAGETRIVVNAEQAIFETETEVKLIALNLYFPEKNLTLTSKTGHYSTTSKNVVIEGDIKANTKGYDIQTNRLNYDAEKGELLTDDKVVIIGKSRGFYMEGDVLTAHGDTATLHKNVKAIFKGK